jgi:hypothetical protein
MLCDTGIPARTCLSLSALRSMLSVMLAAVLHGTNQQATGSFGQSTKPSA